jgi:predicted phosphodiesterase
MTPSVQRKIVTVPLKSATGEVAVVAAGDFHIGATCFNEAAFHVFVRQMQEEAKKHPTYLLLMGDVFDAINVTDKRFQLGEHRFTMDEAHEFIKTAMQPLVGIKNLHFVGSLTGNHELKYCKGDVDPINRLNESLDIEPLGIKAYVYFDFEHKGKRLGTLRTVAFHGSSNSRLPQGRIRIVNEFLRENQLTVDEFIRLNQVAFYGHTHDCRVERSETLVPSIRGDGVMNRVTQYACLTGSFYDIANFSTKSYAAERGLTPSPVGYVKVTATVGKELVVEAVLDSGLNPNVRNPTWDAI